LGNSNFGNFLELTLKVFNEKNLSEYFQKEVEKNPKLQSVSFELCGRLEPHLVNYDFDIDLKPLFKTFENGQISPIVEPEELKDYKYTQLVENIKFCQKISLEQNENYRKEKNLKIKYEYDHFITEGFVLYLLDSDEMLLDRTMYKIKPSDIEEVHWATFDDKMKGLVNEAMLKMKQRNIPFTEDNLKIEMDMQKKEWKKFGSKVMKYIQEQESITSTHEFLPKETGESSSPSNEKKRKLQDSENEPEEKKKKI
jgi:hypothetical protein